MRETHKTKYFWRGQLDWDPDSPDGKYVREHYRKHKVSSSQGQCSFEAAGLGRVFLNAEVCDFPLSALWLLVLVFVFMGALFVNAKEV